MSVQQPSCICLCFNGRNKTSAATESIVKIYFETEYLVFRD